MGRSDGIFRWIMGMYDYVFINLEMLPLSIEEKQRLGPNHFFQTKSLERQMDNVVITDDGRLLLNDDLVDWDDELYKGHDITDAFTRIVHDAVELPYDGDFEFYTIGYRFRARFVKGRLVAIEKVER